LGEREIKREKERWSSVLIFNLSLSQEASNTIR